MGTGHPHRMPIWVVLFRVEALTYFTAVRSTMETTILAMTLIRSSV